VRANSNGTGVTATGATGVSAESTTSNGNGVVAKGATGVFASSTSATGAGVIGHSGKGSGVIGKSDQGPGVLGMSEIGVGGEFGGTSAAIRLRPAEGGEGFPKSGDHQVGELFLDSKANLFFCVTSGKPGVWVQFAMNRVKTID